MIFLFGFAITLLFIQLVYWLFFYFSLSKTIRVGQAMNVPVSVIVCAHDEEQNLRELIPLLLAQNHPEFEIIIVEDRSNDNTYDYLLEETRKHARLKMVHVNFKPDHLNGKKYALTLGIKAARYDWVLLTDADCRPSSHEWIRQMASQFSENVNVVLGYSPYQVLPGWLNAFIRFETMITGVQYLSFALSGAPYMGVGRNLAYRKKLFLESKGFNNLNEVTGGDDDLFVNRHARKGSTVVAIHERALVYSKPKTTWKDFLQQKIRHLAVGKLYKAKHQLMLAPFSASWTMLWPTILAATITQQWQWLGGGILLRWIAQILAVSTFSKKTSERFDAWKLPILDFIFGFYYLVAGFRATFSKRIQWKT